MAEAEFEGELWIGAPAWPAESNVESVGRFDPWKGLALSDFQIAGLLCHHQKFYGLKFQVPTSDPLAVLSFSYLGSHLPGVGNPEMATPLEEILELRSRLAEIDLVLDPVHYARFAEAYLPVTAESAWRYAIARRLPIFERPHRRILETTRRLDYLGLDATWEAAAAYLKAYWEHVEAECEPDRR
ncbi:MAG: hypothetical protein AAGN46_12165, partial [Acidobacteriota bacterium]